MNKTAAKRNEHPDSLLGGVADDFLEQLALGKQPDIEQYAADHPQIASLIRQTFPALKVVNDSLTEARKGEGLDLSRSKQLGDFQLLHELGSGGMGFVYEADQVSMGRRVALKILPMAGALQQKQLLRFRNEVRAAAMLDHPHIVSVFSIGEERGVHFYAMQLIRGQSLAEVIRDLRLVREGDGVLGGDSIHQVISESERRPDGAKGSADQPTEDSARPQPPDPDRTVADGSSKPTTDTRPEVKANLSTAPGSNRVKGFFGSAALLGIQAAEALQHAHDLGVLHRDIKPGNLMLDADAQLFVTDFGLARIEADAGVTMTGDILGTLRYMSPEQALAKRVVIDQRSDIYSLGVTLYELLTLQPAFAGNDRQSLLHQIAFEEPKLPTRINRAIPRELETIVMKAIAKNPRERYATAQELADDLGRYLDDMPIHAKPPSLLQRTSKWSHRNKTFVRSTVATAAVALLIGGALLWQQRSETLAALAQARANLVLAEQNAAKADRERKVAQENFRQTRAAVDDYFTTVSESKLLDVAEMEPLRQELLESAVKYYQRFSKEHANDPELAAELAAAHIRLAHVYNDQGSNKWIAELAPVVEIVERLVNQGVDVSGWKGLREGVLFKSARNPTPPIKPELAAEVLSLCDRAIPIWEKLAESHPDVVGFTSDLAGFHFVRLGIQFTPSGTGAAGNRLAVKRSMEQAIANWERLSFEELGPTRWTYLATVHSMLGQEHIDEKKWGPALRSHQRALEMFTDPDRCPQLYLFALALIRLDLSYTYMEQAATALGRPQVATEKKREALQCFRRVAEEQRKHFGDDSPQVGNTLEKLSGKLFRQAKYNEAEKLALQTLEIRKRTLGEEHPGTLRSMRDLANIYSGQGDHDQAEKLYLQRLEIRKRTLGEEHPDTLGSMINFANVYYRQGKYDHAEKLYLQTLEICKRTLGEEHAHKLTSISNLAGVYLNQGKNEQAEQLYLQLLEILKRTLGEEHPDTLRSMDNLAVVYKRQGKSDQAKKLHLQTLEISRRTLGEGHPRMASTRFNLGMVYAEQTQWKNATVNFAKAAELNPDHIDAWYHLATLQLHAKDSDSYRSTCAAILKQFADSESTWKSFVAAVTCGLAPDAVDDYSPAIDLARRAVKSDPSSALYAKVLGSILYRAGKYEQSLGHQLQVVDLGNAVLPRSAMIGEPTMWFWLAMTHHQLGQDAKARQLLTKAIAKTDEIQDQESEAYKSLFWSDRFWFERLRDEATQLIDRPLDAQSRSVLTPGTSGDD